MGPSKPPAPAPDRDAPAHHHKAAGVTTPEPTDEWTDDPSTIDAPETLLVDQRREQPVDGARREQPVDNDKPPAPIAPSRVAPRPPAGKPKAVPGKPPPVPPVPAVRAPSSSMIRPTRAGAAGPAASPAPPAERAGSASHLASELRAGSPMPATFAKYELLMPVARGGMASVWTARMRGAYGFTRTVAIKVLRPELADSPDFRTMFLDEARVSAMVHHPNVADVLDFGEDRGVLYIVMEWVDGESVARLRKAAKTVGGIPLRISLRMAADAAAGLHAAHELCDDRGEPIELVHRDVSPSNILVSRWGVVKLIDFGVAKSNARAYQTLGGPALKGKAAYLSPEQVAGQPLDRRSDIFSFGTMLYSLTTGRHPFRADTLFKTAENVGLATPVRPRDVIPSMPAALEAIILRALEREPTRRFSTALELQTALLKVLAAIGNPTSMEVAAFVEKVLGGHLAKRATKLRATIAAFDEAEEIRRGAMQQTVPEPPIEAVAEELLWHDEEEATPPAEELPVPGAASGGESPPASEPADSEVPEAARAELASDAESPRPTAGSAPPEAHPPLDFDTAAESLLLRPRRRNVAIVLFAAALLAGGALAFLLGPEDQPAPTAATAPTAIAQQATLNEVAPAPPPPLPPPPPATAEIPLSPPPAAAPIETRGAAPSPPPAATRATPPPRTTPPPSPPPRAQPETPEAPLPPPVSPKPAAVPARPSKFNPRGI